MCGMYGSGQYTGGIILNAFTLSTYTVVIKSRYRRSPCCLWWALSMHVYWALWVLHTLACCWLTVLLLQLMIPGTWNCPFGWDQQYRGWLLGSTGYLNHQLTLNHICADEALEVFPEHAGQPGPLLTIVQNGQCYKKIKPCRDHSFYHKVQCSVCSMR